MTGRVSLTTDTVCGQDNFHQVPITLEPDSYGLPQSAAVFRMAH